MNKRQENYERNTRIKFNFSYNEELLNRAHEIVKNDKNIKVWNLTKIIGKELTILYTIYTKVKKETIQNQFNIWNELSTPKTGSKYPVSVKLSSIVLTKYQVRKYNEILNYFNAKYKTKISKKTFNNYMINRCLYELLKDYKDKGSLEYEKYLKNKGEYKYYRFDN